jgi:hypothetical protein
LKSSYAVRSRRAYLTLREDPNSEAKKRWSRRYSVYRINRLASNQLLGQIAFHFYSSQQNVPLCWPNSSCK